MNAHSKILLTTSRNPTSTIRTFCNDLTRVILGMVRVNRGKMSMDEVAEEALEQGADRVIIVDRWQGGLGKIEFFHIGALGLTSFSPSLYLAGIRLQREFQPAKLKPLHSLVITQSDDDSLRMADTLSKFLNIPVLPEKEALLKYQVAMHISSDAKRRVQITFMLLPQKVEIGPRITLSPVMWKPTK